MDDETISKNRKVLNKQVRTTITVHPLTKKRIRDIFRALSGDDTRLKSDDLFINKILDIFEKRKESIDKLTKICKSHGVKVTIKKKELSLIWNL